MVARLRGRPSPRPPSSAESEHTPEPSSQKPEGGRQKFLIGIVVVSLVATVLSVGALLYLTVGPGQSYLTMNRSAVELEYENTGPIVNLGPFIVNLGDVNERRYLRVGLSLDFKTSNPNFVHAREERRNEWMREFQKELKHKEPVFKDVLLTTASAKLPQELGTSSGKESFKAELVSRFNRHMETAEVSVQNVYFTDFVIQ